MKWVIPIDQIGEADKAYVGGKAYALSKLTRKDFSVPKAVCITTHAYESYIHKTGLQERILIELNRKDLKDMRWEELWDASLRIRNMFLKKSFPEEIKSRL